MRCLKVAESDTWISSAIARIQSATWSI